MSLTGLKGMIYIIAFWVPLNFEEYDGSNVKRIEVENNVLNQANYLGHQKQI